MLAGNGEMQAELEQLTRDLPHVVMPGFINQQEMPTLLGACDIFGASLGG